jgi:hypothetical protein
VPETLPERLTREHREIDALFGRFLAACAAGDSTAAAAAIDAFDDELRRHTALEEEQLYPARAGKKLDKSRAEGESEGLVRELLLEHVQIREVSGMIRHHFAIKGDLEPGRRLAGNLARRWDAHTAREEKAVFGKGL